MRPRLRALIASLLLAACARARADGSELPEGLAPGSGSPRTDREVSRAPADRSVNGQDPETQLIRDHVGIPVPAGSATSRALREGRPAGDDEGADEGADEGEASEPEEPADEGDEG